MIPAATSSLRIALVALATLGGSLACRAEGLAVALAPQGAARPPIGWVDFCDRLPGECRVPTLDAEVVALDNRAMRLIQRVNAEVNRRVKPVSDLVHHGIVEHWSYPDDGKGDCEDYVLEKRRQLIRAGVPRQALLITVVRDLKGDGHSVLTVVTDQGDLVLDNQEAAVLNWSETGYRFIKRQSAENPNVWVSLGSVETAHTVAGMMRRR